MGVYTKTGDQGQTSLFGGDRIAKNDQRVDTYGTIDEANSVMGLARSLCQNQEVQTTLYQLQQKMFVLGAQVATPLEKSAALKERITVEQVSQLEGIIDEFESRRNPNHAFVVPGNSAASAALDIARTVVRRAERLAVGVGQELAPDILRYLNRLSDLLFVLARVEEETALVELVKMKVGERLAQGGEGKTLSLQLAKEIIEKCEAKAREIQVPMVIAVVDKGGNLVACHRQDEALLASLDIAVNKAYTAAALKLPTHVAAELSQPGKSLYGLQNTNQGRIVIFGGGYPLMANKRVIGALGVSGGSVEEDMQVAQAGINFFEQRS